MNEAASAETATETAAASPGSGSPTKICDLVMKGGITSGIAYPAAIDQLRTEYRFRNIGGTSAGAIAAAATAAAEFGRWRQLQGEHAGGFERLVELGDELARPLSMLGRDDARGAARDARPSDRTVLQGLFQPTDAARPAFEILQELQRPAGRSDDVTPPGSVAKGWRGVWAVRRLWPWGGAGAIVAVLLGRAAGEGGGWSTSSVAASAVLGVLGFAIGLVAAVLRRALRLVTRDLPTSYFGMCMGMPVPPRSAGQRRKPSQAPALTEWLHEEIQRIAGLPLDRPLTFRDLATVSLPIEDAQPNRSNPSTQVDTDGDGGGGDNGVRLRLMTTDVTLARPVRLPLEDQVRSDEAVSAPRYLFSPVEFERLFPTEVVDWMCDGALSRDQLHPLPYEDLPVLVATRMSLSFPVLLSAVPLYTDRGDDGGIARHWMSDGGISSNFPIHFFDSLVPRWPTFALRFVPHRNGDSTADQPTTLDTDCDQVVDRSGWPDRLDPTKPARTHRSEVATLPRFLAVILDTMQNWTDTLQSELPGVRDRIEDIALAPAEGGMNLGMSTPTIHSVQRKGACAGEALVDYFEHGWEAHRFIRYMMAMRLLDDSLGGDRFQRGYSHDGFDTTLEDGIDAIIEKLKSTDGLNEVADRLADWYDRDRCAWAKHETDRLLEVLAHWRQSQDNAPSRGFSGSPIPNPHSELRVAPPV